MSIAFEGNALKNADTDCRPVWTKVALAFRKALKSTIDPHTLLLWWASAFLAAFAGPFGTYQREGFWELFVIWLVLLGIGTFAAYFVNFVCRSVMQNKTERQIVFTIMVIASFVIGTLLYLVLTYIFGRIAPVRPGLPAMVLYSFAVMCVIAIIRQIRLSSLELEAEPDVLAPSKSAVKLRVPSTSRLARRLELPDGERIVRIAADGHFVEVHTSSDVSRIRMRFSDAVEELDGTVGLTVHRSHWVHRDAIRGWVPQASKPYVVLLDGTQVTVSRTFYDKVGSADLAVLEV